jgi:hypothetical protein
MRHFVAARDLVVKAQTKHNRRGKRTVAQLMQIKKLRSFIAGALTASATNAFAQSQTQTIDLFASEPPREYQRAGPAAKQVPGMRPEAIAAVTYLALSPAANRGLRSTGAGALSLRIALPNGKDVTCTFDQGQRKKRSAVMNGTVDGSSPGDRCDILVEGGRISGDIDISSGRYRILPVGQGDVHAVVEVKSEAYPNEAESPPVPRAAAPDERPRAVEEDRELCDARPAPGQAPKTFGPVRVMILYTPAARASSANIQSDIRLLMDQLKQAFSLDRTGGNFSVSVELANAQEVRYAESASMDTDLDRLTNPRDPVLGYIHGLRDRYGADLVHLLIKVQPGGPCGIGWLNAPMSIASAATAFSVSDRECAINNYSFAHELGHNFGMNHDRAVVNNAPRDQFRLHPHVARQALSDGVQ